MSFNQAKVKAIEINDDGYNTYGYDDDPIHGYCNETKQDVEITILYRGTNKTMHPLITLYQCNKSNKKIDEEKGINLCADDRNCNNYCKCHKCLCTCGDSQKWEDATGINHKDAQEKNSKPTDEMIDKLKEYLIWKDVFEILDDYGFFGFTQDSRYLLAKEKMLKGHFSEISKEEYTQILGALKSAESKLYNSPLERDRSNAYLIRRIVFHGHEIGCDEFAKLKDKYGGCYIATVAYGSYDAPQVRVLRKFRDNYLEKRFWGRKFVQFYYKFSPSIASKLKNKLRINSIIRYIFTNGKIK